MRTYKWHLVFWLAYFIFCYLSDLVVDTGTTLATEIIVFLTNNVYLFYSISFLLLNASFRTPVKIAKTLSLFLLVVAVFFLMRYVVRYHILAVYFDKDFGIVPLKIWAVHSVLWVVNYFFIASAYYYFVSSLRKQKQLNQLLEDRLKDERERLELESTLFKNQVNPHFLYNALSFLYAKALPVSQDLSNGILRLSDIMRYSLGANDNNGQVTLSDEVTHIRNVICMAEERFNNQVYVDFQVGARTEQMTIIPFVLITLVENILKHGVINDDKYPAMIKLDVSESNELTFTARNKKRRGPKEASTSIGLNNTRKRLEYAYGGNCKFEITETTDDFSVSLSIPLQGISPEPAGQELPFPTATVRARRQPYLKPSGVTG